MKDTEEVKKIDCLKVLPHFFLAVEVGIKTFEIRKNDRNYKVGQLIILEEYDGNNYTGRNIKVVITYLTDYKQADDYVVFSFAKAGRDDD